MRLTTALLEKEEWYCPSTLLRIRADIVEAGSFIRPRLEVICPIVTPPTSSTRYCRCRDDHFLGAALKGTVSSASR